MRTTGKITHWNADKGYGFITPNSGAKQVFVHIRAFGGRVDQPAIGQLVTFELGKDNQSRPCAERVTLAGDKSPGRIKRNDKAFYIGAALVFLLMLGAVSWGGLLPMPVWLLYLAASGLTFLVYWMDKAAAQSDRSRTPENTLHLLALLGGWPGAMIAQQVLRHKSSKREFRVVFWMTVVVNCVALGWLFTESGRELLQAILA